MSIPKARFRLHFSLAAIVLFSIVMTWQIGSAAEQPKGQVTDQANMIAGEWQRADGSYLIRISEVKPDGRAAVQYFNPRPIHVAEASISTQEETPKLFIKFQDKGYEGSSYTLYYYAEKDAMLGIYHQAALDKYYRVLFLRTNR